MNLEKANVTTTKLNIYQFPNNLENKVDILVNINLEVLKHNNNKQGVILTYILKSEKNPIYLMWECNIDLSFDEKLIEDISEKDLFSYSDVLSVVDKQINLISKLMSANLPLLSEIKCSG